MRKAIELIATLKAEIGDLSQVKGIAKVFGMVNATDSFTDHSKVIIGVPTEWSRYSVNGTDTLVLRAVSAPYP